MKRPRSTVYICGYPKSGTTYLTRLLGDLLDSPTGGSTPAQDKTEPASEGHNRLGPFMFRKGHYIIGRGEWIENDNPVPRPHVILPANLRMDEKVICLFRDPRDIAVSASYYFNKTPQQSLFEMHIGTGNFKHCKHWGDYVLDWMTLSRMSPFVTWFKYEDLIRNPTQTIKDLVYIIGGFYDNRKIKQALHRQSIEQTKIRIKKHGHKMPLGRDLNSRLVRKGKPGDWRNHFSKDDNKLAKHRFGVAMEALGYE